MKRIPTPLFLILLAVPALAQLAPFNYSGVTVGHVHLAVKDVEAQKQFWTNIMGGTFVKDGPLQMVQFPGLYVMLEQSDNALPNEGAILDHFGFVVKDMPGSLAKWKAANLKIEPTANPNEAYVFAPDGVRLEVYGVPELPTSVQMNHIHLYCRSSEIPAMQAWYVKTLSAMPGERECISCLPRHVIIKTANFPGGTTVTFRTFEKKFGPSKGHTLDRIGFEVKNLDAYAKKLEAEGIHFDQPVHRIAGSKTKSAVLTDPWGNIIELTESPRRPH
jgi:catechol 2,3-dioxygenase-like lactoylglutathione lyase family enzyme